MISFLFFIAEISKRGILIDYNSKRSPFTDTIQVSRYVFNRSGSGGYAPSMFLSYIAPTTDVFYFLANITLNTARNNQDLFDVFNFSIEDPFTNTVQEGTKKSSSTTEAKIIISKQLQKNTIYPIYLALKPNRSNFYPFNSHIATLEIKAVVGYDNTINSEYFNFKLINSDYCFNHYTTDKCFIKGDVSDSSCIRQTRSFDSFTKVKSFVPKILLISLFLV